MFFSAEKSQLTYPGPSTALRPSSPKTSKRPSGSGSSCWKALVLNHSAAVRGPELGLPITLGRLLENPEISGACPCSETSLESNTVKGVPLIAVKFHFNCQLPRTLPYHVAECCRKGRLHW